jgi:hypothetical protein
MTNVPSSLAGDLQGGALHRRIRIADLIGRHGGLYREKFQAWRKIPLGKKNPQPFGGWGFRKA